MTTQKTKLVPFDIETWKKPGVVAESDENQVDVFERSNRFARFPMLACLKGIGYAWTMGLDGWETENEGGRRVMLRVPDDTDPLDEICPGHNPDRLTRRQVETDKGWRLLEWEEVRFQPTADIQLWSAEWSDTPCYGGAINITYRTRKPPGYYLPKPRRTRPLRASDWDGLPVVWIKTEDGTEWFVSIRKNHGFWTQDDWRLFGKVSDAVTWSTDCKNWKPFTVEETE